MRISKKYTMLLLMPVSLMIFYSTIVPKQTGEQAQPVVVSKPQELPVAPAEPKPQQPIVRAPQTSPAIQLPASNAALTKRHEKYTQTQAYFEVPELKQKIEQEFTGFFAPVEHMDVISRVIAKEAEFRDTHWAFYHGISNVWTVWQDTYTALFDHFNPNMRVSDEDFIFLRTRGRQNRNAKDFLIGSLKEQGLVDDNGEAGAILLSTNISLFGNTGLGSESTWRYIMKEKEHKVPDREMYESIMDEFGLAHTYIDKLMQLVDLLKTRQQTLLQVFVPKNMIDEVGYLAWATGIPAHQPSIDWVKNSGFRGKAGKPGALWALAALKDKFKNEQEKNPLFKEMLETIEKGGYSLDAYLKRYCNEPLSLTNMNYVQARLIFTDDILLNPASGVKMFRHEAISDKAMQEYKNRLDALIKQIIATKK